MSVAAMVAISAFAWAALDVVRKQLVAGSDPRALVVALSWLQVPGFVLWSLLGSGMSLRIEGCGYGWWAAVAVGLNLAALRLYLFAVRVCSLGSIVPLLAFVPVFGVCAGAIVLGQVPTLAQAIGIALVCCGALWLRRDASGRSRMGLLASLWADRGALAMIGVAALWSLTIVVDRFAVQHASMTAHGAVLNLALGALAAPQIFVQSRTRALFGSVVRRRLGLLVVASVLGVVGLGLQMQAVLVVDVGLFEAIKRAVGITSALVVGRLMFGESTTPNKLIAAGLLIAGASIIYLLSPQGVW